METIVYFARKNNKVILPSKRSEDAGFDIYAYFEGESMKVLPHETKLIPTGLYSCCLPDFVLVAKERGSTGSVGMKCSAGIVDSGYRNEIFIAITNNNDVTLLISKSVNKTEKTINNIKYPYAKAIAQLLVLPVPKTTIQEITIEQLQSIPSMRGLSNLGASGK